MELRPFFIGRRVSKGEHLLAPRKTKVTILLPPGLAPEEYDSPRGRGGRRFRAELLRLVQCALGGTC
jgi:hypothetical protein